MPQFRFKLDAVLRQRAAIEKQKQRDLALVLAKMKDLEDQLKSLNQTMQSTNDDLRTNRLVGQIDVNFITAHRRFLLGMQRKAMDLVAQMAAVQKEVDAARAALAEAAKAKKVLEKLRENQHNRWKDDRDRREMAQLDEVAMQMSRPEVNT